MPLFTFNVVKAGEAASETLLRLPRTFHHEISCKQQQWKEICSFQNERLKEHAAEKLSLEYQTLATCRPATPHPFVEDGSCSSTVSSQFPVETRSRCEHPIRTSQRVRRKLK